MKLKDIKAEEGTIKALILQDADGDITYIRDVAEHGCSGGSCNNLIYYVDTHAFYNKFAGEIDGILENLRDEGAMTRIDIDDTHGDLRNYLAWLSYEVEAQNIINELEQ